MNPLSWIKSNLVAHKRNMFDKITSLITPEVTRYPNAVDRLNPPIYHSRYHHLTQLRHALTNAIDDVTRLGQLDTILDYGCGGAFYEPLFISHARKYLKADIDPSTSDILAIRDDGTIALDSNSIDLILSTQVIEHVPNPAAMLEEIWRLLKPGGHLLLTTHGHWMYHPDPTDYWRWTIDGLNKIIQDLGFEVVGSEGVMGLGAVGFQYVYDSIEKSVPLPIRPVLAVVFQGLMIVSDQKLNKDVRNKDASVFVILARKPRKKADR